MKQLGWLFALILVLSACGPQASPTPIATAAPTATPTATRTPRPTPTLIPTLTAMPPRPPTAALTPIPPDLVDPHGVPMQLVPAGEFIMGSEETASTIYLDAFYIDRYEVTIAFYQACIEAGVCAPPDTGLAFDPGDFGHPDSAEYPFRWADWFTAEAYCEWRGAHLPSEAEWEKAARGSDGRTYPWGEGKSCDRGNFENCHEGPTEVGSYAGGRSPFGVYDMAGNVEEWVADQISPSSIPSGLSMDGFHKLKSSHWSMVEHGSASGNWEDPSYVGKGTFGFRCARSAP